MRSTSVICSLLLIILLFGCNSTTVGPASVDKHPSIGEIHNEVLTEIFSRTKVGNEDAVIEAVNTVSLRYGVPASTRQEVQEARQLGRSLAALSQEDIMSRALSPEEMVWWRDFNKQVSQNPAAIREIYQKQCATYGTPEVGSIFAAVMDVYIHSAEFWYPRYSSGSPKQQRWLQFLVTVAVDAVVGGASSGALTPAGGAIAGGLASEGANSIMNGN